jgi:starch-binding outer membrane protein, SusD/RagB family
MKIKPFLYALPLVFLTLTSCEDTGLDPTVENTFDDDHTWRFDNYAEGVLMKAYANIPTQPNYYENNFLDVATDNAVTNNFGSGIYNFAAGAALSPHSDPIGDWSTPYSSFNYIHLFLQNGLTDKTIYNFLDPATGKLERNRLKGEAFFLRAWWGFQLLREYGGKTATGQALGYPIVTQVRTQDEVANAQTARNTYEECVQQILADIDTAMFYLPQQYTGNNAISGSTGLGRADDQISLALKSRTLLYASSPAYQNDNITRITGMGQFTVADPAAYTAKWVKAAQAAQAARLPRPLLTDR